MYQPVTPRAAHVAHCFGFSWATIHVPVGANGVVLILNGMNTWEYANKILFRFELRMRLRLRVMVAWWISRHHRPQVHGEVGVKCAQDNDEVCLECSNHSLCRVASMDVWWYQLLLNIFLTE
jgi:hypothetical protein